MNSSYQCPNCGGICEWLSTENEWENYCPCCDIRFNSSREILSTGHWSRDLTLASKGLRVVSG